MKRRGEGVCDVKGVECFYLLVLSSTDTQFSSNISYWILRGSRICFICLFNLKWAEITSKVTSALVCNFNKRKYVKLCKMLDLIMVCYWYQSRYLKEDKPHGSAGGLYYFRDIIMEDCPVRNTSCHCFYHFILYCELTWEWITNKF